MLKIKQLEQHRKVLKDLSENPELRLSKKWRMDNLYWIVTKDGEKEVFIMNGAQRHFFETYLDIPKPYHRHVILKSRQLGFTTLIDLYILDEILFKPNKEGLIIAHKLEDAKEIFDRKIDFTIRNMVNELKDAMFKIQRNSAKKIQVVIDWGEEQGSTSSLAVSVSGRSGTFHLVHVSEYAKLCVMFPQRAIEVITGTFPSVPLDGFIFMESTAEGMGGSFYDMFQSNWHTRDKITPMLSRVKFLPHFYNWTWDEMEMKKITEDIPVSEMDVGEIDWAEYQQEHNLTNRQITYYYMKWLQLEKKVNSLRQEYPTTAEEAFVNSGQMYYSTTRVVNMLNVAENGIKGEIHKGVDGKTIFQPVSSGDMEIYEQPQKGVQYIIGGDTSEGLAHGDAQVAYVINASTEKCAGVYSSQVPPDEFADALYDIGMYFNYALLAVEVNKDGLWVNDALDKKGYTNIYYRKVLDDITKNVTKYFGWKTTSSTRPFMLAALRAVFLRLKDGFAKSLLQEMLTFVRNEKGKAEAMSGKHDDVIMAASVAYAVLQERGKQILEASPQELSHMKRIFGEK